MVETVYLELQTEGHCDMHDLTDRVQEILSNTNIHSGIVSLFSPSSTSALTTIEFESGALGDLERALDEIAPADADYAHNLRWGDGNGHAHLRAALLGPSLTVPVIDKRLSLGTWQQILFIDFDVRPRSRKIVVQITGDEV